jgi:hypothetical protein
MFPNITAVKQTLKQVWSILCYNKTYRDTQVCMSTETQECRCTKPNHLYITYYFSSWPNYWQRKRCIFYLMHVCTTEHSFSICKQCSEYLCCLCVCVCLCACAHIYVCTVSARHWYPSPSTNKSKENHEDLVSLPARCMPKKKKSMSTWYTPKHNCKFQRQNSWICAFTNTTCVN